MSSSLDSLTYRSDVLSKARELLRAWASCLEFGKTLGAMTTVNVLAEDLISTLISWPEAKPIADSDTNWFAVVNKKDYLNEEALSETPDELIPMFVMLEITNKHKVLFEYNKVPSFKEYVKRYFKHLMKVGDNH